MIGITSYGAYIPRLRLERTAIFQAMGWFAPALVMVAQGERSMCNHDEDALTMAVAAARDCLTGIDKGKIDGSYLCSTTLPFADRQNAGILKTALNLGDSLITADFTASLRAGTTGLITALEAVTGGSRKNILVTASDKRETKPASFYEMWFGDGAAALLVGDRDVIAEFKGSSTVSYDFVDHYRGAGKTYDYTWEERWLREEAYSKFIPEAVGGLFKKLGITMDDVQWVVFPCIFKAEHKAIAKKLGATPEKVIDTMHEVCGETGAAHPLLMFAAALEQAKPGDGILLAGFGQGCDALYFKATEAIAKLAPRAGVKGSLENKKTIDNYMKFLKFRNLIDPEMGIRAEAPTQTAMTVALAEPQDAHRPRRRQVPRLRDAPVPEDGHLREPEMRPRQHPGRLRVRRPPGPDQELHGRPPGRLGRPADHLRDDRVRRRAAGSWPTSPTASSPTARWGSR